MGFQYRQGPQRRPRSKPRSRHVGGFSQDGLRGVLSLNAGLYGRKRANVTFALNTGTPNTKPQKPQAVAITNHNDRNHTNRQLHNAYNHINTQNKENNAPCNVYFGENFAVRTQQWFKFLNYLHDNRSGGIVHCDFVPNRKLGKMNLSTGAEKIRDVPNAGGSSVVSEVLSFELLQKVFKAKLLKTEMEVAYFPEGGSITDYVCDVFGTKVGVSVTRAMNYWGGTFTFEDAQHLLNKKLKGVNQATRNTLENWNKQVLHVWSANNDVTNTLVQAYVTLPDDVKSNTVVLVTTTTKAANYIYTNCG